MKTLNFNSRTLGVLCPLLYFWLVVFGAQLTAQEEAEAKPASIRPEQSDEASQKLIGNYLTVSGGKDAHDALRNVFATGTITEAGKIKSFKLVETQDGKRHLTLTWRHLGRDYEEVQVFDGLVAWSQQVRPELEDPENLSGQAGIHFSRQRWLLQPFALPSVADYSFKYQGGAKVLGRDCYVIVGFGKKDVRSWFYFDKETFLLLRWGGLGKIAGVSEYMDYRATKFKHVGGVSLPTEIDLLAENAAYGKIQFEEIQANQDIDFAIFNKPLSRTPVLRQRTND